MLEDLKARADRLWKGFLAFTPGQKAVTIAAVLALTIGGYMFSAWASKPSYAPLYTNLSAADASAIVDKLNSSNTPYKLAQSGSEILVPQNQVYSLRLTMSAADLPASSSSGYSLLDKEGVTTSQSKFDIDVQRALEGELDRTIKSINGVLDAQVHLAIPPQNVFNDGSQKTTAAVLLTIAPGSTLANGQVQSVVNLVAASVPDLDQSQVSVSDSTGRVLSNGTDGGQQAMTDAQTAQTTAKNTQLAQSLQAMLDKITGPGHSIVTVNAALNFDKSTIQSQTYTDPSVRPSVQIGSSESYGASGGGTGGVVGATSATPSMSTGPGSTNGGGNGGPYLKTDNTAYNPINQSQVSTVTAPGSIKSLAVAVAFDKSGPAIPQAQLQNLVSSAIGFDKTRGDTLAVESVPFDTSASASASADASKAAAAAASAQSGAAMSSMIKTGLIVVAILGLIIFVFISNKRHKRPEEPDDLDLFLAQLNDSPGSLPPAPVDIIGPKTGAAQNAAHHQRQISELADENPDEVARLLRGWLNSKDG